MYTLEQRNIIRDKEGQLYNILKDQLNKKNNPKCVCIY